VSCQSVTSTVDGVDDRQNPIGPFGGTGAFTDAANKTVAARTMLHKRMLEKRMAAKVPEFRS
jgi:hypothetical protein